MAVIVNLDVMLAKRKMKLSELANRTGLSLTNLSLIKTGKIKGIRFNTLNQFCDILDCQPGDLLEHIRDEPSMTKG
ncbi:MAG: helix-turn-helix transcriptional regulator [Bacteroidetes bacterium]|jgi:putative transcriptional regulator|nr:helix-turn-helix transcriptional regulator [Bacteroidota bacterium]MBT3749909.1 helix-turn-helix transcriptional regulator [Bacteroidota bacterium]MBT4401162.1 helix-turn-helix transcriptional regulator [Bacteroidota bacterium]MBT4411203.1 helix-turn-helix transcriptional regulator [Bacteroidota bacterium]MBT4967758.1 helix-turn-helix transcriptional regulator [Bacteroidota bacterium]